MTSGFDLQQGCPPAGLPLNLLYCDDALAVASKPAGLLSVPGRGPDKQDCLTARVQAVLPDALVVHRLDQATSGLLVFGRGAAAQRALSIAFAQRRVDKRYIAVVAGWLDAEQGDIDLPLSCDWPNRPRQQVDAGPRGKPSLTRWRRLGPAETGERSRCRLELEPVTGRSHQLRVHLAAIGHPILGDDLYADEVSRAASPRLLLHAQRLSLPHPLSGEELVFEDPAPF